MFSTYKSFCTMKDILGMNYFGIEIAGEDCTSSVVAFDLFVILCSTVDHCSIVDTEK